MQRLTLSCFVPHLYRILSSAIHNSPNNGQIDLLPCKEMIVLVLAIYFCTLNHVSQTIIDEVTVPLSKGVVGLFVGLSKKDTKLIL
jgi:hypothetical protein